MPVAATVIGNHSVATGVVLTPRNVTTERRCSATLDGRHDPQLVKRDVPAVGLAPSGTMVTEYIRNLQGWLGHGPNALRRALLLAPGDQIIERALDPGDHGRRHERIACRRLQLVMAQQRLDLADVDTGFE